MAKILLIEDDDLMVRMYSRLFTLEGYETETAENGEAGFVKAKEWQPDLILLDIMMPKMNGLEVIQKLKQDDRTRNITVILLTNLGIQEKLDEAMRFGAAAVITKSNHSPEEVINIIKDALAKTKANAA